MAVEVELRVSQYPSGATASRPLLCPLLAAVEAAAAMAAAEAVVLRLSTRALYFLRWRQEVAGAVIALPFHCRMEAMLVLPVCQGATLRLERGAQAAAVGR